MRVPVLFSALVLALSTLGISAIHAQDWLGVNLQSARDYQTNDMFADAMKSSREWGSPTMPWDMAAPVDADGWPTGDAGVVVKTGRTPNIGGVYALSFTGRATVTPIGPGLTIRNLAHDAASNTSTGELVVDSAVTGIMLSFTNTNGGVRNVKLMRPGHTNETFNRAFIDLIAPFKSLRFMWVAETIDNPVVRWQDRTPATYATMNRRINGQYTGTAWEYCIELCNQTRKDMWICIPDLADDDYVTQLATLLRDRVHPDVNIYVEFSNEVWNNGYQQTRRNFAAAQAEVAAGGSNLNFDGETNPGYLAWRRVGLKTRQISDLFRAVFGDAAMMTKVRPVLSMWNASNMSIRQPLEYLEANYGPPRNYLYAIANAPYFGIPLEANTRTDLTADECIAFMQSTMANSLTLARSYSAWARWYGLKFVMYEGGLDMHGAASLAVKIQVQRDPRTAAMLRQFFDGCNQIGLDHLSFFTSISADTEFGMDGLTTRLDDLNHPKYQAMLQAVAAPPAPPTIGSVIPGSIPAGSFDLQSAFGAGGTPTVTLANRGWYNYILRAPAAGTYSISPSANGIGGGGAIEVALGGTGSSVRSWSVATAASFGDLPAVEVTLQQGLNMIRIRSVSGNVSLRAITVGWVGQPLAIVSAPTALPSRAEVGEPIRFDAFATGENVRLSWNFGDGSSLAEGSEVTHAFAAAGTYAVRVTATDAFGQALSDETSVTVNAVVVPPPPPSLPPLPPLEPDSEEPFPPLTPMKPDAPVMTDIPAAPADGPRAALPISVAMMKGIMSPSIIDGDSCIVTGTLTGLPAGVAIAGTRVNVSVGEFKSTFTLSQRNVGRSTEGSIHFKLLKAGKAGGEAAFKLVLRRVTLSKTSLAGKMPMEVSISVGDIHFEATVDVRCVERGQSMKFSK